MSKPRHSLQILYNNKLNRATLEDFEAAIDTSACEQPNIWAYANYSEFNVDGQRRGWSDATNGRTLEEWGLVDQSKVHFDLRD